MGQRQWQCQGSKHLCAGSPGSTRLWSKWLVCIFDLHVHEALTAPTCMIQHDTKKTNKNTAQEDCWTVICGGIIKLWQRKHVRDVQRLSLPCCVDRPESTWEKKHLIRKSSPCCDNACAWWTSWWSTPYSLIFLIYKRKCTVCTTVKNPRRFHSVPTIWDPIQNPSRVQIIVRLIWFERTCHRLCLRCAKSLSWRCELWSGGKKTTKKHLLFKQGHVQKEGLCSEIWLDQSATPSS